MGTIQLPELMLAVDHATRFSWRLLGRAPTTERELLLVYAGLLAHGTELNATSVALMIPGLTPEAIAEAMRLLEEEGPMREANELVVQFLHRHAIVKTWGGDVSKEAIAEAVALAERIFEDHAMEYAEESLPA